MRCPACGQENPDGFRFCGACGAALEALPAREERKVVSVLFADLVGFTARAEAMDPEDVRALLAPYHARLREELERYGGTVEKFIGDAVMALFGAPVAHEDDPERAVRAAIAIRDWAMEEELHVRIAVNTGEALVALGARPEAGEGMVSGDVVNTTARLQAAAPVNGILVGETTYRATREVIDYRDAEPARGKGKAEPTPVWEAVTPRARVGVDVDQSTRAPLVGRQRELGLLVEMARRVREAGEPQLVTLVGVPGIGKSRLAFELFEILDREADEWVWRQGRCLPYGEGATFWPLGEIVKSHAQIFESDPLERAKKKLSRATRELIDDATEARWIEQQLRPLLGLGGDGGIIEKTAVAFAAWRRFLEALAEATPLVLVIEDLHWADDAMLEFLDELVEWTSDVAILVLATARPEFLERRSEWGGGKANATTLSLAPLSEEETKRLLAALLQRSVLEADAQQTLLERAGGNPLYAEQYAHMFLERGEPRELGLPETIQGLIAARLDQLPADEKGVLQDASVHGKVFWAGALTTDCDDCAVLDQRLHSLERKQFVRRQRRSSVADEAEYTFRHMLVRDVAYAQIPRAARAEKHRRAAEWIESLTIGRDDHVDLLAEHYGQALELARSAHADAFELVAPARNACRKAGERAESLGAFALAERYFARALELCEPADPERPEILLRLGRSRLAQDRGGLDELMEASAAFITGGEHGKAAEAEAGIALILWNRAQMHDAATHFAKATDLVRDVPDSPEKARVLEQAARTYLLTLRLDAASEVAGDAVALCERAGFSDLLPACLCTLGHSRLDSGDPAGIDDIDRSIEVGRELPSALQAAVGFYLDAGIAYLELGALDRAFELWEENRTVARESGNPAALAYAAAVQVRQLYYEGDWDGAFRALTRWLAQRASGSPYFEVRPRTMRALMQSARGDVYTAFEDAERALALGRGAQDAQTFHTALAVHCYVAWIAGDDDTARSSAAELLDLIAKRGTQQLSMSLPILGDCVCELELEEAFAEALAAIRKSTLWVDAARAQVEGDAGAAAEIYARIGSRPDEARAHLRAAHQLARCGKRDAEAHGRKALDFYRSVGATRYVREAEKLLPATA